MVELGPPAGRSPNEDLQEKALWALVAALEHLVEIIAAAASPAGPGPSLKPQ
jgi:hypothetical protein